MASEYIQVANLAKKLLIKTRKDKRKPYFGAKAIDKQCRNNGKCEYCKGNRTYANEKRKLSATDTELTD